MIVWGVISACTAATHSFGGLIAIRFMLGFVEAAYFVSSSAFILSIGSRDSPVVCSSFPLGTRGRNWASERLCYTLGHFYQGPSRD